MVPWLRRLPQLWSAIAVAWMLVALPARAGGAPPTPAQLEQAKQAYADGKQLHDAGKLAEAIEKFKLSYELSGNPLLLYDIGLTMQQLGSADLAVVYYRRFLVEAPPDAAQRRDATERIAAITQQLAPPRPAGPGDAGSPSPGAPAPAPDAAAGFAHRPVEAAPPGQPLDLTAAVPDTSGLVATLWFRNAGQAGFTSTPMVRRREERVGRIPASRMTGSALQYYLEVRDPAGAVVARSGKSTVPNVIAIDPAAPPRFYPDVAEPVLTEPPAGDRDAEDPLARGPGGATGRGDGVLDVGSRPFAYAKWSSTAVAGAGVGLGVALYVLARDHASALVDDATGCGSPPCQKYDDFDRGIERTGKLEQTISNVALFGGLAVAAVAGYFWYRELTADRGERAPGRTAARARRPAARPSWVVGPSFGPSLGPSPGARSPRPGGFTGAAAAVRF